MSSAARFLSPAEASRKLGVSAKALRLYEQRGLLIPVRTQAGWRAYGPAEMAHAAEIVALRALGLSLGDVARVFAADALARERILADHEATLGRRVRELGHAVTKVRRLRADLGRGERPGTQELIGLRNTASSLRVAFDLPWPWAGERFELREIRPLTYIVGPLGSGKTHLAKHLAEALPRATFVGLDRLDNAGAATRARLEGDPALAARVRHRVAMLVDDGAVESVALMALIAALESEGPEVLVIDMLEQGLDAPTQESLIAHLRRRGPEGRPLFCLTRSNAILDLESIGADETIILCPANHSPPGRVAPHPGSPGYEAVATCLASPEVRARTEGVIAFRSTG